MHTFSLLLNHIKPFETSTYVTVLDNLSEEKVDNASDQLSYCTWMTYAGTKPPICLSVSLLASLTSFFSGFNNEGVNDSSALVLGEKLISSGMISLCLGFLPRKIDPSGATATDDKETQRQLVQDSLRIIANLCHFNPQAQV
jgi:hypothetical protein